MPRRYILDTNIRGRAPLNPNLFGRCRQDGATMILPKARDPRFITIRRGGTLTDADHQLLALWAATCAEHVLHLFESARPSDPRPRQAIEQARAWVRGEIKMSQARAAAGHANAAARELSGAARARRLRGGPGSGGRARRGPRARGGGLRDQGRARRRAGRRGRDAPVGWSASGSASNSQRRFATSSWTTSDCATHLLVGVRLLTPRKSATAQQLTPPAPHPSGLIQFYLVHRGQSALP